MITYTKRRRANLFYRIVSAFVVFTFSLTSVFPPAYAQLVPQTILNLPVPGAMVTPTPAFVPVLLKGMTIHPENPLQFDFIVDSGNTDFKEDKIKTESERLVKYFLASMTIPKDDLWVNLSPYESGKIIPEELGKTELGRDMLAQDYILKQLTASLMYPEKELGRKFWDRVYQKIREEYGTIRPPSAGETSSNSQGEFDWAEIPVNTFNKVWILPETATVYEHGQTVYIVEAKLKVMLDEDYLAASGQRIADRDQSLTANRLTLSAQIIREIILPEIEKEVNEGQNFAPLRQIYHSLILAKWYKETIKESLLSQIYVDQKKIAGINLDDATLKDQIYAQYMEAYRKGVFNYIKEDYDRLRNEVIPRKYFSGGIDRLTNFSLIKLNKTSNPDRVVSAEIGKHFVLTTRANPQKDGVPIPKKSSSPINVFDLTDNAVKAAFRQENNEVALSVRDSEEVIKSSYERREILPIHYSKFPDGKEKRYYLLARQFFIQKHRQGFDHPTFNNVHILAALFYHLEDGYAGELPVDPEERLIELFKRRGIKHVLEVGTSGNNNFAIILNDIIKQVNGSVSIIDLSSAKNLDAENAGIHMVKGDARRLKEYFGNKKFDLILNSGVLSHGGVSEMGHGDRSFPWVPPIDRIKDTLLFLKDAMDLLQGLLDSVSENPKAAIIVNGLRSHIVLFKEDVEKVASIRMWDNAFERHHYFDRSLDISYESDLVLNAFRKEGASLMIVGKQFPEKGSDLPVEFDFGKKVLTEKFLYDLGLGHASAVRAAQDTLKELYPTKEEKIQAYTKAMDSTDTAVQQIAAILLAELGVRSVVSRLKEIAKHGSTGRIQRSAEYALQWLTHSSSPVEFDLKAIAKMNDDREKADAGLTLIMGGPFEKSFQDFLQEEQQALQEIFNGHGLGQALVLYDLEDIHATLIGMEGVNLETPAETLKPVNLVYNRNLMEQQGQLKRMNINYALGWAASREPFEVEIGPGVLAPEREDQIYRITSNGLIVIKGRATAKHGRDLLWQIRQDFEQKANIHHKYAATRDDEFFFVIGYLKPDARLNNEAFQSAIDAYLRERRGEMHVTATIDSVKAVSYTKTTIQKNARAKEIILPFGQRPQVNGVVVNDLGEYFLGMGQKIPTTFSGVAIDTYGTFYNKIRNESSKLSTITEGDLERSRIFLTSDGRLKSYQERLRNGSFGVTEVFFVPNSQTRTNMAVFQQKLKDLLGDKVYLVDKDKLHFTTQGFEEWATHRGLSSINLDASPYHEVRERAREIKTPTVRIQVAGVNWDPSIGIFWGLRPYVTGGEDPIIDRRKQWGLFQPRPLHITAAYFAQPLTEREVQALRALVGQYQEPTYFGDIQIDQLKVIAYEDFSFNSGYRVLETVGLEGVSSSEIGEEGNVRLVEIALPVRQWSADEDRYGLGQSYSETLPSGFEEELKEKFGEKVIFDESIFDHESHEDEWGYWKGSYKIRTKLVVPETIIDEVREVVKKYYPNMKGKKEETAPGSAGQSSSPVRQIDSNLARSRQDQKSWRMVEQGPEMTKDDKRGGIDMNAIDLDREGAGVDIQFDPAQLQELIEAGIDGFAPVIINIVPLPSVLPLLGLDPAAREKETLELSASPG